jgi:hypothetical protein
MVGGPSKGLHEAPSDWNCLHKSRAVGAVVVSPALQRWEGAIKEESRSPGGTVLHAPRTSFRRFLRMREAAISWATCAIPAATRVFAAS